jgi:hypothetical protein
MLYYCVYMSKRRMSLTNRTVISYRREAAACTSEVDLSPKTAFERKEKGERKIVSE